MLTPYLARLPALTLVASAGSGLALAAPGTAPPAGAPVPPGARPAPLDITFDVDVGEPMMIAGQEQSAYIKITLGGFALPQQQQRAPINLGLVLGANGYPDRRVPLGLRRHPSSPDFSQSANVGTSFALMGMHPAAPKKLQWQLLGARLAGPPIFLEGLPRGVWGGLGE